MLPLETFRFMGDEDFLALVRERDDGGGT